MEKCRGKACRRVKLLLLRSALVRLIVLSAPRVAALATVMLTAPEGTAEIPTTRIAWMRTEANPAVAARHCAALQILRTSQGRFERQFIQAHKRADAVILMPILTK
jgi:hypothetical protein